ncbi:ParA family protein [Paenibacillus alvei]|uniref:ParA family protein n=1 Tax=Paenibacillus alvei TaxID=44250 RepID=UPI00227EC637|nr:ParA family protein [Paenibacillus alvei]MCY9738075.1 ParA family protein [Paenibacillus alvei]
MKTISIINLKGGVAKTISSVNIAHILATVHGKRVLLVDNDKQGNASKMFGLHSYSSPSIADVMTERNPNMNDIIVSTSYAGLDVIPANMNLLRANMQVLLDTSRQQQTRLGNALKQVADRYDYCIIDNAPDINISVINALVASHDVLIPVKIDKFAFDGLAELKEQIENTRDELNPNITIRGCFVTCYQRNEVNMQGEEWMKAQKDFNVFQTHIRKTEKVDESTFACMPITEYSRRCGAAMDYLKLVSEYLNVSDSDTKGS